MAMEAEEQLVIIVGAGPAGLATAACLKKLSIPYVILEREDCFAPLLTKKTFERFHLHLVKQICELPHMPFPTFYPKYVPKKELFEYFNDYVSHFEINPLYNRSVVSAVYDEVAKKWIVEARNANSGKIEEYSGKFLVVATGENSDAFIPEVEGLSKFKSDVIHSTQYKCGEEYENKRVLVVGSGNSGMEIALDLANYGAKTSIVVRSPTHFVSRGMMYWGMKMLRHFRLNVVDWAMVLLSKLIYGDLSKYGIPRPQEGPLSLMVKYRKYPVIDLGTCKKIKSGEIQVLPGVRSIAEHEVFFENGKSHPFDSIVFATGFTRSTNKWLKGDDYLLNEEGIPKPRFPNHWKGEKGLYCAGLARLGLNGAASDAQKIANELKQLISN